MTTQVLNPGNWLPSGSGWKKWGKWTGLVLAALLIFGGAMVLGSQLSFSGSAESTSSNADYTAPAPQTQPSSQAPVFSQELPVPGKVVNGSGECIDYCGDYSATPTYRLAGCVDHGQQVLCHSSNNNGPAIDISLRNELYGGEGCSFYTYNDFRGLGLYQICLDLKRQWDARH